VEGPVADLFGVVEDALDVAAVAPLDADLMSRNAGAWRKQTFLKARDAAANDHFGHAVAVSRDGDTVFAVRAGSLPTRQI